MNKKVMANTRFFKVAFIFPVMLLLMALLVVGCGPNAQTTATGGATTTTGENVAAQAVDNTVIARNECSECHEMWPEVATWQTSVHSRIACTKCHTNVKVSDFKAAHDSGNFAKPINTRNFKVDNKACTDCHAMNNRVATPMPDIIIPHDQHDKAKVTCLDCHRFIAHGNIAERKVTTRAEFKNYDQWNPTMAQKAAPGVQRRPNMFVCINCHEARKVTTKCAACHYWPDRASLPSHENPLWKVAHGKPGRADINNCAKCHYDKESQKFATPSTGDQIADFARANSYCYGCHLKRPADHDAQWMGKHASYANNKGVLNCFACHDKNQPGANVTGTYCNTCHWFPAGPVTTKAVAEAKKK